MQVITFFQLIQSANYNIKKFVESELRKHKQNDIRYSHFEILRLLLSHGYINMEDLAKQINKHKSTITALVKKLLKKNLVSVKKIGKDDRKQFVDLTEEGKKFVCYVNNIEQKLYLKLHHSLCPNDQKYVVEALTKLNNTF